MLVPLNTRFIEEQQLVNASPSANTMSGTSHAATVMSLSVTSSTYGLADASCLCCRMPEMLAYESSWVHVCGHVMSSWNRRRTVGDSSRESLTDLHWNCIRFSVARLAFTCW